MFRQYNPEVHQSSQTEVANSLSSTPDSQASSWLPITMFKESLPVRSYIDYLREHGEDHAEWLTDVRKNVLAPAIGALSLASGLFERTGQKDVARTNRYAALALYGAAHISDGLDGFAIRQSGSDLTSERRIKGADDDRIADQAVSEMIGWGMVLGLRKDPVNQWLQSHRVKLRRQQVARGTEKGYDTKADKFSKIANEFQGVADTLSLMKGLTKRTFIVQSVATVLKYGSMVHSERRVWPQRLKLKEAAITAI